MRMQNQAKLAAGAFRGHVAQQMSELMISWHLCPQHLARSRHLGGLFCSGALLLTGDKIAPPNIRGRNLKLLNGFSSSPKNSPPFLHNVGLRHQSENPPSKPIVLLWTYVFCMCVCACVCTGELILCQCFYDARWCSTFFVAHFWISTPLNAHSIAEFLWVRVAVCVAVCFTVSLRLTQQSLVTATLEISNKFWSCSSPSY